MKKIIAIASVVVICIGLLVKAGISDAHIVNQKIETAEQEIKSGSAVFELQYTRESDVYNAKRELSERFEGSQYYLEFLVIETQENYILHIDASEIRADF